MLYFALAHTLMFLGITATFSKLYLSPLKELIGKKALDLYYKEIQTKAYYRISNLSKWTLILISFHIYLDYFFAFYVYSGEDVLVVALILYFFTMAF